MTLAEQASVAQAKKFFEGTEQEIVDYNLVEKRKCAQVFICFIGRIKEKINESGRASVWNFQGTVDIMAAQQICGATKRAVSSTGKYKVPGILCFAVLVGSRVDSRM